MAKPLISIPVPAAPGNGAGVNISGVNTELLLVNWAAKPDDVILIQTAFAAPNDWQTVAAIQGQTAQWLDVEGLQIRAVRQGGSGGAYNIHATAQAAGNSANAVLAIPAVGTSAALDVSAQPQWLNLFYDTGSPLDFATLLVSIDGVAGHFAPLATLQGANTLQLPVGAGSIQVSKLLGGNAGNLRVSGIPAKA